uniref:Uncharacterized protein n=1 Tax=Meloidogyne hapla TaxID=6305 RepID=A0A1I8AX93_MELHA
MSEKQAKDDRPEGCEQQSLQQVEANYHDLENMKNMMETCFNKLTVKERSKENKKSLLSQLKPSNNGWPQILQFQLNFNFYPPKTLTDIKLKEQLNLLFKCFCEVKNQENDGKQEISLDDGHEVPQLDGMQITCLSQLVVQYMWEIYRRQGHQLETLLPIIAFLEWAKNYRSDTASIQIMLCRLYGIFGCVERIKEMEKQIQLKFIQKDSLAFLRFFIPYQFGRFKEANIYYTDLGVMFDMNERETNECLVNAYKNNSFAQISHLFEFSEKANNSIFSIGADILNRILTVCFTPLEDKGAGFATILIGDEKSHPIAIGNIGNILLEDKIANLEMVMVECSSVLDNNKEDFESEEIFENYINIQHLNKLITTHKLFNLPILLLNISLDIQKQFKEENKKTLILKQNLNEEINFTNSLNFLEKFYKNNFNEENEGNNKLINYWNIKIELIKNLAIVIEILALSLIACKLLETTSNAEHLQNIDNPISTGSSESIKRSEKSINNTSFLNSLRARAIQPIGGCLKRIRLFLTKNFDSKQQMLQNIIENDKKLNEIMEIMPESIRHQINNLMKDQILKWLNESINCSVKDMNKTCEFLLANFC